MKSPLLQTLSIKPFLFLWLAEIFSQIAMNMMNFMLLIVVFALTNSNTAVSGIVLSFTIPAILFGILAGVYVDRWNKKQVLLATNFSRAFLLLLLALLHTNLVVVYVLTFAIAIVTQFFIPAETPMIPILVEKKLLLSANALFSIALYGSIFVAYALSGPFLLLFGPTTSFLMLALLFLLPSVFVLLIKSPERKLFKLDLSFDRLSLKREFKQTLALVFTKKAISSSFLLLAIVQIIILVIAVVGPGYAKTVLGIRIAEFPLLFITPAAIGMGVGAFVMTHFFHAHPRKRVINTGIFLSAGAILLLPFAAKLGANYLLQVMFGLAFLLGFGNALVFVPANTILQEETSDDARGKIYGALNTFASIISFAPVLAVGSLADLFGVPNVLLAVGGMVAIIGIIRLVLT